MSYENQAKYMKIPLDNEMDFELVDDDSADEINNDDEKLIVPDLKKLLSNLQLAPTFEIAYFYLQDAIGLKQEVSASASAIKNYFTGYPLSALKNKKRHFIIATATLSTTCLVWASEYEITPSTSQYMPRRYAAQSSIKLKK